MALIDPASLFLNLPWVKNYGFWLAVLSLGCLLAERLAPWRLGQALGRPEFGQDLFWLIFNGYLSAPLLAGLLVNVNTLIGRIFSLFYEKFPESLRLISDDPLWLQILLMLVLADFLEWLIHNALHRLGPLWKIHRVHHSIRTMDWIGNFRFHWGETILYNTLKYLPLALLGARWEAVLVVAVISTAIGHLNHANLNISWGPFRYIFNSPRMHIWHHEKKLRGRAGVNFAVVFSLWDWIFGTAYMPRDAARPEELGYTGQEKVSDALMMRFFLPFLDTKRPA
jgi:sterol desaturase/sphingolipid hydroxylase (fatty acid hydroxylase superfamily)